MLLVVVRFKVCQLRVDPLAKDPTGLTPRPCAPGWARGGGGGVTTVILALSVLPVMPLA
jgi:hypothetical protein